MTTESNSVPSKPPSVFLSYAREDHSQAIKIVAALQRAGLDVHWDGLIEGGELFAGKIETALDACDAVIVAWSRHSVVSDWVRDEARKGRDQRKLVPLSLDGVEPPLGFGQYHAIDLSRWRGNEGADQIAAILRGVAAVEGVTGVPAVPPAAAGPLSRRRILIAGITLTAVGAATFIAQRAGLLRRLEGRPENSVAVLPFANLSGDPAQNYFSDGVSEEVRATLARSRLFRVMAEASSATFRDRTHGAVDIAAALGVAYLLDGSVRRSGSVVRIAADLIDGGTGFSRWAQSFDRQLTDIFALQSEIANAVAHAVAAQLAVPGEASDETTQPQLTSIGATTNVDAYDAYLRGRSQYDLSADEASERAALSQFDLALQFDPQFASAHAARSRSLVAIATQYTKVDQLANLFDAAIAAAQRAIAIAPDFADAHSILGLALFSGHLDARAARAPYERSLSLGGGDAPVLGRFALFASRTGRHADAESAIQRALSLDPLNALIHGAAGTVQYAARHYAAAISRVQHALQVNAQLPLAHATIGNALLQLGRTTQAQAAYALERFTSARLTGQAIVEWRLSHPAAARAALAELVSEFGDQMLYQQGQVLAQWGDSKGALTKLENARELRDTGLLDAGVDPLLDPLRTEHRFALLLKRLGFG